VLDRSVLSSVRLELGVPGPSLAVVGLAPF
jgi:hypothetical protein